MSSIKWTKCSSQTVASYSASNGADVLAPDRVSASILRFDGRGPWTLGLFANGERVAWEEFATMREAKAIGSAVLTRTREYLPGLGSDTLLIWSAVRRMLHEESLAYALAEIEENRSR